MRWFLLGLGVFGLAFVALLILAPGHRGRADDPPGWTRALGRMLSGFAPRIRHFADGSDQLSLLPNASATVGLAPDDGQDTRLLMLKLTAGGPVRVILNCSAVPGADCPDPAQILCLGTPLHSSCTQKDSAQSGTYSVNRGGTSITLIEDGGSGAQVVIGN